MQAAPGEDPGPVRTRPVGERGCLIQARAPAGLAEHVRAAARDASVALEDVVVGAETVLVVAASPADRADLDAVVATATATATATAPADPSPSGRQPGVEPVEIPVTYEGEDLEEVAALTGMAVGEVVALHQAAVYEAEFSGFAPGFAYLSGLPRRLWLPRRPSPRSTVPAGSVAIADRYSAVYPGASPGGWHLLGRTTTPVWDAGRHPPALLRPGTPVRFVAVRRTTSGGAPPSPPQPPPGADRPAGAEAPAAGTAALEVVDPGLLTTVQDAGRPGRADQGVSPSGWLDAPAARLANRLVGNGDAAAVLEATLRGPSLRLLGPPGRVRAVAVTGADAAVTLDGREVATNTPLDVHPGSVVGIGWATAGARTYVAVSGGVDATPVLGSRSTDLLSGLGPLPLAAGQRLPLGPDHGRRSGLDLAPVAPKGARPTLRVLPGPRADWLAPGSLDVLVATVWTVATDSNRIGVRLRGAALERARTDGLPPEGLVAGAVQVPPAGQPVLFLADHPVTGGYPVLAVVIDADLHLAAQLAPGATVAFALAASPLRSTRLPPGRPGR